MNEPLNKKIDAFIREHQLPDHYREIIDQYALPLAEKLVALNTGVPLLIGINGAQGTGKSTMSAVLALLFEQVHMLRSVVISIDDLYLTRTEREQLAGTVHPLLKTRGVPGTHDIKLGLTLIRQLKQGMSGIAIPGFDKAMDDRRPPSQWQKCEAGVDVILLEGWCVGTPPQCESTLEEPVNSLEADEDTDGRWRHYVNEVLAGPYQQLFSMIDFLVLLKAPDFETVYHWRGKQEEKLGQANPDAHQVMSTAELSRFIQHYERLTRHNLQILPQLADVVFVFDHRHQIVGADWRVGAKR